MADFKAFSPTAWRAFTKKCSELFPFLKKTFQGTTAEWSSLSVAERTKYDIVNLTDDEEGTPEYYSTAEVKTNKVWIDGKPIYRRVIKDLNVNLSPDIWTSVTTLGDNVETLIMCYTIAQQDSFDAANVILNVGRFKMNPTTKQLQGAGMYDSFTLNILIIEYTKTAD